MTEKWVQSYKGLYRDGAVIKTEFDANSDDIAMTLARDHNTPDEVYVMTGAQANELIYALSKALLEKWEWEHDLFEGEQKHE